MWASIIQLIGGLKEIFSAFNKVWPAMKDAWNSLMHSWKKKTLKSDIQDAKTTKDTSDVENKFNS